MSPESFEELAHAALEGTATPSQRSALEARLATDPSARDQWHTLQTAFFALAELRPEAPPPDLKQGVLRAVLAERAAASAPGGVREWLGRAFAPRLASAFVAGVAAGILVWALAIGRDNSFRHLPASGTMMPLSGSEARPVARASLHAGASVVAIETYAGAQSMAARIDAGADGPTELVLEHDPTLVPQALEGIPAHPEKVSFAPGRVTFEFTNDLRCTLRFRGTDVKNRSIRVTVRSAGGTAARVLEGP